MNSGVNEEKVESRRRVTSVIKRVPDQNKTESVDGNYCANAKKQRLGSRFQ